MPGIIAGIDGSAHSPLVLEWAIKEAALRNTAITVITIDNVPANPWTGNPTLLPGETAELERIEKIAEELTHQVTSRLGERRPPSVSVRAAAGYPAKELIDASEDADLVVVGSRGAGGFARLLLGSVSSQVVQHAHCPVVVVHGEK
jgi:nucleotide-binding universal stress UspA family protein